MAFNPPDRYAEWCTGANGTKTDPGATLRSNGWAVGDAPASSHFNYLMNAAANSASFNAFALQANIAYNNIEYEADQTGGDYPWGDSSHLTLSVWYRPETNRWYAQRYNAGLTIDMFESFDGESWTRFTNVYGETISTHDYTPIVAGGGYALAAAENYLLLSRDGSLRSMRQYNLGGIELAQDAAHDPFNGGFWIVGESYQTGRGYTMFFTYDDLEQIRNGISPWQAASIKDTVDLSNVAERVAVDPNTGNVFITTNSSSATWYATDISTVLADTATGEGALDPGWTAGPTLSGVPKMLHWDNFIDRFILHVSANLWYINDSWNDVDTTEAMSHYLKTPDFNVFFNSANGEWKSIWRVGGESERVEKYVPGDQGASFTETDGTVVQFFGGQGKLMWAYDANPALSQRAITRYGASRRRT